MPLPAQSALAWHVFISILHVIAITSTVIRLTHRWRRLYLWWDDWATVLPLICDVIYFVIMWLTIQHKYKGSLFTSFWFGDIMFFTIVWVSRASLALSIARIFPERHLCRRIAFSLTGVFIFLWIACVLMGALECYDGSVHDWWNVPFPLCVAKRPSVKGSMYLATSFDFVADLCLVIAPLVMLWRVKLPMVQRRLVLVLFSCSVLTMMASVFFVTLGLAPLPALGPDAFLLLDMGGQLQGCVSIIVCNLLVVATLIYRVSKKKLTPEPNPTPKKEEPVRPPTPPTPPTPVSPVPSLHQRGSSVLQDRQSPATSDRSDDGSRGYSQHGTVITADVVFTDYGAMSPSRSGASTRPSNTDYSNPSFQPTESRSGQTLSYSQNTDSKDQSVTQSTNLNSQSENTTSDFQVTSESSYSGTRIDPNEDPQLDTRTTAPPWSFPETQGSASAI